MSSGEFVRYSFTSPVQQTNPVDKAEQGTQNYTPQEFSQSTDSNILKQATATHLSGSGRFKLDSRVANQMQLDQSERKRTEDAITKELEERWIIAKEKAEVAGFSEGLERGKKDAFAAQLPIIQEKLNTLDQLLSEIDSQRLKIFEANEKFLMELIAQIARLIVLKEVEVDPDYIKRVVVHLLEQISTKEDIRILLSPQDASSIQAISQEIQKQFGKLNNTVIETSSEIPLKGCKIETKFGVIDASVQTQIENIVKALATK